MAKPPQDEPTSNKVGGTEDKSTPKPSARKSARKQRSHSSKVSSKSSPRKQRSKSVDAASATRSRTAPRSRSRSRSLSNSDEVSNVVSKRRSSRRLRGKSFDETSDARVDDKSNNDTDTGEPLEPKQKTPQRPKENKSKLQSTTSSKKRKKSIDDSAKDEKMEEAVERRMSFDVVPDDEEMTPPKEKKEKGETNEDSATIESQRVKNKRNKEGKEGKDEKTDPKPSPVIDTTVHRMRHLGYKPKGILNLATTPFNSDACDYIAVSREGGSVELKSPDEKWRTVAEIAGMSGKTVDVMAWLCGGCSNAKSATETDRYSSVFHKTTTEIQSRRSLIGGSNDGTLFVIDFASGGFSAMTGSGGGGIFSLTSLCGLKCCRGDCPRLVAAGCEDGSVRVYRLSEDVTLELVSTVPCASTAILSLAWRRFKTGTVGIQGTTLFAGVGDGTIRRFDCEPTKVKDTTPAIRTGKVLEMSGTWKSSHRITVESYGRATPTRVWALVALADGTIASGDSLGHVQFWDGHAGTLIASFDQNENRADVLTLATTLDESGVFASGIDSRIIFIERPKESEGDDRKWLLTHSRRPHSHDVKALTTVRLRDPKGCLKPRQEAMDMLCSGGVDMKLCSCMIKDFHRFRPKVWYPWPATSKVSLAKKARLVLLVREDEIELHTLGPLDEETQKPTAIPEDETLVGTMEISGVHNVTCGDISDDGKFLAVSNGSKLLLFVISYEMKNGIVTDFNPNQVQLDKAVESPCLAMKFVSNETLVCSLKNGDLRTLHIKTNGESESVEARMVSSLRDHLSKEKHSFPVHTVCSRRDGKYFATVRSGVGSNVANVFANGPDETTLVWSVPPLDAPVCCVGFLGDSSNLLAVACSNFAFYVFDFTEGKLSDWSEKIGFPMSKQIPHELEYSLECPVRVAFNPALPKKFLVGTSGSFAVINTELGIPSVCRVHPENHLRGSGKKRKRMSVEPTKGPESSNCALCFRYNGMLAMDFCNPNEMVIVEQPWMDIVKNLPDALDRKIYGT